MAKICWICILLSGITVFAQEKTATLQIIDTALPKVLTTLEQQFGVKFSYIDATIQQQFVSLNATNSDLSTILQRLEKQTQLKFEQVSTNFIAIRPYNDRDHIGVCGYIYDAYGQPLSAIRIFFKASKTHRITDANGYFENNTALYNAPILISAPGFRQRVINSATLLHRDCINIELSHTIETLDEVLIEEYITKGVTLEKKVVAMDLANLDILPNNTSSDILQSIQLTPGVNSPFETASGLHVRGSTPHQNLVLWNGIKTYHQGHFFGMLSAFNPYASKEVRFSKSGVSAQYGDRIASVIDITTDTEIANRFRGGAGFTMMDADVVLYTPILKDKISAQVSARRSFTDVWKTITYDQFADRVFQNTNIAAASPLANATNDFYYTDYNATVNAQLSDAHKIEANALYSKNELDFKRVNTESTFNDLLRTENEGYNIKWKYQWNTKLIQKSSFYYSKYLLDYQFISTAIDEDTTVEHKKNSVQDIGAEIDLTYQLTDAQTLQGGYHFSKNKIRYAFFTTTPSYELVLDQDDRSLNTHSLYTEYKYNIPNTLYITAGARFNYYTSLNKALVEPRLFVEKNLNQYWKINVTGEYRSQAVSQIKESIVSDLSLENQVWTIANNEQFPIITSYQFTIGGNFKKRSWYVDIDSYYKQIHDITSLTAGFLNPVDNSYNIGQSTIHGMDVFVKRRFHKYKTWVSYSYINARNKFEAVNDNNSFPGNWNIEHTLKWSHFYTIDAFQFSLGWLWHTGKAFTNVTSIEEDEGLVTLNFEGINSNNLPVYHRLDAAAIYEFAPHRNESIKYRIGLSVQNVYNQKNILNREFRTTNALDNRFISADIISLGITPNLSFRIFW